MNSFADYAAIDGVNWSTLRYMRESALHYKHRLSTPIEDTIPMALGRATHTLVFEPALFEHEYVIWEGGDRRGNAWKAFEAEHAGQTIFKPAEIAVAVQMADAVKAHPLVQPYLDDGVFEQPITWTDPATGLPCKAKPDWLQPTRKTLVDLKTSISADGRRFGSLAARLGYHCQMAMYRSGIQHALQWFPQEVCIIVVEREAPHDVAVFRMDEEALTLAFEEVQQLMQQLAVCRRTDTWPGRYTEKQSLQLPAYLYGEMEFEYE